MASLSRRSVVYIYVGAVILYILLYTAFFNNFYANWGHGHWFGGQLSSGSIHCYNDSVLEPGKRPNPCSLESCFNYTHCPVTKPFLVFVHIDKRAENVLSGYLAELLEMPEVTNKSEEACVVVVSSPCVIPYDNRNDSFKENIPNRVLSDGETAQEKISAKINSSVGFHPNQVLLRICQISAYSWQAVDDTASRVQVAAPDFEDETFRLGFDIVIPPLVEWEEIFPSIRQQRTELLYFIDPSTGSDPTLGPTVAQLFKDSLNIFVDICSEDKLKRCRPARPDAMLKYTFGLLVANGISSTDGNLNWIFVDMLRHGMIPIVLGKVHLPFGANIDWERAAILLPVARLHELASILKAYDRTDIETLRRQGRDLFTIYLSSPIRVLRTMISCLRSSLKMPAVREPAAYSPKTKDLTFYPGNSSAVVLSEPYRQHIFLALHFWKDAFNIDFNPYTTLPWKTNGRWVAGTQLGITGVKGIAEQFTAIILTYNRATMLLDTIANLRGLPELHKVLVVWNGPQSQRPDNLTWPEIGAPIQVVQTSANSLNNRNIFWKGIETEAVLSLDDDVIISHKDLQHGFRVWRHNRDTIVGYNIRHHAFDRNWQPKYTWNKCNFSMVLTGNAFLHMQYLVAYTVRMHPEIRGMVDKLRNCEDIAMNFLVSHITQRPPIYVYGSTQRFQPRSNPSQEIGLHLQAGHSEKRVQCLQRFTEIFGYTPLWYSHLRTVSIFYDTEDQKKSHPECPNDV